MSQAGCSGTHPVDEGGLRAPAEGVAVSEGLIVYQPTHGLDGSYDLLVCCFYILPRKVCDLCCELAAGIYRTDRLAANLDNACIKPAP